MIINGISVKPGPDLPYPLAAHYTFHIGGNLFFIAGGFEHDYKTPSKKAFLMECTYLPTYFYLLMPGTV